MLPTVGGIVTLLLLALLTTIALKTKPICWLPEAGSTGPLLGTLITAQAAIAALALAVTLFVLQGLSNRRDTDDRMYREYVRRSWARGILSGSLLAVGTTGVVLLAEEFIGGTEIAVEVTPGLRNLVLIAAFAFFANLVLAAVLFERAFRLGHPEQLFRLRRGISQSDVQKAVQVFLNRNLRAVRSIANNQPDLTAVLPDPGEGSADESIRALLDDALRAMHERRLGEFNRSIESIKDLVTYAMDEIERKGFGWSPPGRQPEWPPLRELSHNLYSLREEVIHENNRDYVFELLFLDHWLVSTGVRRGCGELFSVGLDGYRRNSQIANPMEQGKFREILRDRLWQNADGFIASLAPEKAFPFTEEMVRHQERILSEALHEERSHDYEELHKGFEASHRFLRFHWKVGASALADSTALYGRLQQEYRVSLMTLAGRAALIALENRIDNATPYLDIARGAHPRASEMAGDLAEALDSGDYSGFGRWPEWEMEGSSGYESRWLNPERYPLAFFAVRLMELSGEITPTIDLHGNAKRVLDWFEQNSELLERYVKDELGLTNETRRESAANALRAAVHRDEVAEDYEIIQRQLSEERISNFTSDVYGTAFGENPVERVFGRSGAFLYLVRDADGGPEELLYRDLAPKGFLADVPEDAHMFYPGLDGGPLGRSISEKEFHLLSEALDGAPKMPASMDTPRELLDAIDRAIEDLSPSGGTLVVLTGDWGNLEFRLAADPPEGYELPWQFSDTEQVGEMARYRGNPILRGPFGGERRLYIVEPGPWGCFMRAQCDGDLDLLIVVNPISVERARELLAENQDHFATEPDEESKLRKLQTYAELAVTARIGFRVKDASRARRIIDAT